MYCFNFDFFILGFNVEADDINYFTIKINKFKLKMTVNSPDSFLK